MKNKILEIESKCSKYIKYFEETPQNTHELNFQRKILFCELEKWKNMQESYFLSSSSSNSPSISFPFSNREYLATILSLVMPHNALRFWPSDMESSNIGFKSLKRSTVGNFLILTLHMASCVPAALHPLMIFLLPFVVVMWLYNCTIQWACIGFITDSRNFTSTSSKDIPASNWWWISFAYHSLVVFLWKPLCICWLLSRELDST